MKESKESKSYIHLEATYPHKLLLCMKEICDGDKNPLLNQEEYLKSFHELFPNCPDEWKLLKTAYDKKVIDDFFSADREPYWQKRVTIQKNFLMLMGIISERNAAALLESLMFIFHWDFFVKIKRRWNTKEEEWAQFHTQTEIDRTQKLPEILPIQKKSPNLESGPDAAGLPENDGESAFSAANPYASTGGSEKTEGKALGEEINSEELFQEIPKERQREDFEYTGNVFKQKPEEVKFYQNMSLFQRRILKKALSGDTESQCEMGAYYSDQSGGHLDYREAIRWYEAAAEKGTERALFEIGRIYDINGSGIGGEKDKALKIYRKLAVRGYPTAQCVLGMKYRLGDGVKENLKEAAKWLEQSALQGHDAAIRNLADLYRSTGELKKAEKWYRIGAAKGDEYCIRGFGKKVHR